MSHNIEQAQALFTVAMAQHQNGHLDLAQAGYEAALQHNPYHIDANQLLGMLLSAKQDYARALSYIDRAIALYPKAYNFWGNRALALEGLQRYEEALSSFERALEYKPDCYITWYNRGNTLRTLGRLLEAVHSYERAAAIDHQQTAPLLNASTVLQDLEKFDDALAVLNRALSINPHGAELYLNRGNTYKALEQYDAAVQDFQQAIALQTNLVGAHFNLGLTFHAINQLEQALNCYDTALRLAPSDAKIHYNRGVAYQSLMQFDKAIACYDQAIALEPQHPESHWNKAVLCLTQGQYELGWSLYEWRWQIKKGPKKRSFSQPRWLGEQPLAGKTILLYSEQGMGDTLQFCRYVSAVKSLGAKIILAVDELVERLVINSPIERDVLLTGGSRIPHFDYYCPILSLPLALRCFSEQEIPAQVPYLVAPASDILAWKNKLGARTKPRVGLAWAGGIRTEAHFIHVNRLRNISFATMARLQQVTHIDFFSLQKGADEAQLSQLQAQYWQGDNLHNHTQDLHDFADTAALMSQLDLVISVDTSVAHLAGALGKPVWLLLPKNAEWRWLLERTDSPWYPSMRLIRQTRAGDWEEVLERVAKDLQAQFA